MKPTPSAIIALIAGLFVAFVLIKLKVSGYFVGCLSQFTLWSIVFVCYENRDRKIYK